MWLVQELWLLIPCLGTVMTSFVGRNLCFHQFLVIFGCYIFCLNLNFYGFELLLLEFK